MHTLGGNEELALHGVTSHCWDRRDGPPRGHNQWGEPPKELSTYHITQVGSKMNTQHHWQALWRGKGLENATMEKASPPSRGKRGNAELKGQQQKHRQT